MTDATGAALELLRSLGAAAIPHPGGRLLAHLVRTHDQLAAWDQPPEACLAGLCHSFLASGDAFAFGSGLRRDQTSLSLLQVDGRPTRL